MKYYFTRNNHRWLKNCIGDWISIDRTHFSEESVATKHNKYSKGNRESVQQKKTLDCDGHSKEKFCLVRRRLKSFFVAIIPLPLAGKAWSSTWLCSPPENDERFTSKSSWSVLAGMSFTHSTLSLTLLLGSEHIFFAISTNPARIFIIGSSGWTLIPSFPCKSSNDSFRPYT